MSGLDGTGVNSWLLLFLEVDFSSSECLHQVYWYLVSLRFGNFEEGDQEWDTEN